MNAAAESPSPGLAGTKPPADAAWTRSRWLTWVALIFAAHVGLLFAFGARKPIVPRPIAKVLTLSITGQADELLALNDPTLFVLPHPGEVPSAIPVPPSALSQPSFGFTEPPGWLSFSGEALGMVFHDFMQTNRFAGFELQLKPPLEFSTPASPVEPLLAQASTVRVEGDLTQRPLLNPVPVPSLPDNDVIAPSRVQVLVDAAGNVISAVVLPLDNPLEAAGHDDGADRRALELARAVRFAPAPRLTFGRLIFNWHTVPLTSTNEPGQ